MTTFPELLKSVRPCTTNPKFLCFGLVRWKPTAEDETFTTALKGGYVATVWKNNLRQYFKLENSEEQTQILVTSADSDFVDELYSEAERKAFNVNKAIADIIRRGS